MRSNVGVMKSNPIKPHKRFTKKGHRMARHLKGKVKEPYAVVMARNHEKGLVKKSYAKK